MYETREGFLKEKNSSRNRIFYNFMWNHVHRSMVKKGDCKLESVQRRAGKVTKRMELGKVNKGA